MCRLVAVVLMGTPTAPLYIRTAVGYKLGQNLLGFVSKESGQFRYRI
jgi:hypothetical protein